MLKILNLTKDLGQFVARDITLEIERGEYMVIIGPTGAGKTILLETIAGIYSPDEGSIYIGGKDVTDLPPRDRHVCMVYQDYMLFPHLNIRENIAFGLKSRGCSKDETDKKVEEIAEFLTISHLLDRKPDTLSGGEQQRTAIARALVMDPVVLLLDEPLSALDGRTRDKLRKELKHLHAHYKITVLHVTHNFEEVFSLADRVAVMNDGRIAQIGKPEEVFRRPNSEFIADFVGVENLFSGICTDLDGASAIDVNGHRIISNTCGIGGRVYASIRPEDILVSTEPFESSARNRFHGKIVDIADNGTFARISVDAGIPFIVILTRLGFEEMALKEGDMVYLTFKASSVHVFG